MTDDLLERTRKFVDTEVLPETAWLDARPDVPTPLTSRWHEAGLSNWWLPERYGGPGASLSTSVDVVSELSYGDAGFAFGSFLSILGTTLLHLYGDHDLADGYLTRMAGGGGCCAILISEQEAGSELHRTATTITADGDALVLDGEKYFSTNTDAADFLIVAGRAADDPSGYSLVLVPRDAPGVEVTKRWDMIGLRGSGTYAATLRGVRVPAVNRLSGNGLRDLEAGLNASRILIAATAIGTARRVRDVCMAYAATKKVKGALLVDNDVFAAKLGQMEAQIDVMRNQCLAAAAQFDGLMAAPNASGALYRAGALRSALAAKMHCGQAGWQVATTGSEMFGGLGFTHEHVIGKLVRDLRYVGLVEGGDDVVRDLLFGRYVLPAAKRL
ncbi:acyl-CoA dehydrogenase family protein [Pseudonocardia endophytica]|uniref:Medium-chain specific acyl-CoA dehydrogenase, mitochondrial n=1 Tax=Pseudonocardia endophytica TaxID=401976 RepID=A0A4V2PHV7_PSEEN|nr:acyl-CoA dehydrogenase family protein [Pseudonocardia endophytica]TCK22216.1 alkylation response protein AidB-like acyl-CoA dehydrogenase [Pseudonocardia endophytica]